MVKALKELAKGAFWFIIILFGFKLYFMAVLWLRNLN